VLCAVLYTVFHYQAPTQFLFLACVPLFVRNGLAVSRKPSSELDPFLKQMAISTLLFVLLFGAGLLLA
jgi:1,4-dihydroxy-2-naphthoate octaprenyltransferase